MDILFHKCEWINIYVYWAAASTENVTLKKDFFLGKLATDGKMIKKNKWNNKKAEIQEKNNVKLA